MLHENPPHGHRVEILAKSPENLKVSGDLAEFSRLVAYARAVARTMANRAGNAAALAALLCLMKIHRMVTKSKFSGQVPRKPKGFWGGGLSRIFEVAYVRALARTMANHAGNA